MGMTKKEFDKMRFAARDAAQDVWDKERAAHIESQTFHGDVLKEAASTAIEVAALCGFDFCSWHVFNQHDGSTVPIARSNPCLGFIGNAKTKE